MLAFVFTKGVWAQTKEAYAEVSTDGTTLTFYYNANRLECKGETYDLTWDNNGPGWYEEYGSTIATATFDISFDYFYELTNIHDMFAGLSKLYTFNHLEYLHTDKVTNMAGLFAECESLISLNLSSFNTSQVTDMSDMFYGCESLTSLNLSSFNTSKVTNMCKMFCNCKQLTFLDLSNFDMTLVDRNKKLDMCSGLSTTSRACTIVCTESVQNSLLEYFQYIAQTEDDVDVFYYYTDIPVDEVTFTWVRP